MSPWGMHWRISVSPAADPSRSDRDKDLSDWDVALHYSSADGGDFADVNITPSTTPEAVAEAILTALPALQHQLDDPAYADWYTELLHLVEQHHSLPIAYAAYFDPEAGWEIGWGSGVRFRHPPVPPT